MIRDTPDQSYSTRSRSRSVRSHLRLPGPHFDATQSDHVLRFLDRANNCLQDRNTSSQQVGATIREICGVTHMQRRALGREAWHEFVENLRRLPITKTLHEDAFTRRSFEKPRGYAGDAVLLDYIYGTEHYWSPPEMSWVGQRIFRWSTISSASEGVKARRAIIARKIDRLSEQKKNPRILSLAAGHFREAELCRSIIRRETGRILTVDSDAASLQQVEQDYSRYGVETLHASARELMSGRLDIGTFDLIYTSGLCDYLSDSMCARLAHNLFEMLDPGGQLLLTNFVDHVESVGYMEAFMDWNLIFRDRIQMMEMTRRIPESQIREAKCFSEEFGNVLFLEVEKAGGRSFSRRDRAASGFSGEWHRLG